jgi:hypothetical protein
VSRIQRSHAHELEEDRSVPQRVAIDVEVGVLTQGLRRFVIGRSQTTSNSGTRSAST